MTNNSLGFRVRSCRRQQDLTLRQLAARCAERGAPQLNFTALANIERGAIRESSRAPREVSTVELVVLADALGVTPVTLLDHAYLSTGCLHGKHDYCQSMTGYQGEKRPGQCKFCEAACVCTCHAGR